MNINYYFKNIEATEALKDYASEKAEKVRERLHHIEGIDVRFSVERQNQSFEISIHADSTVFHIKKTEKDMYAAMDKAVDVLNKQIDRYNKKNAEKSSGINTLQVLPVFESTEDNELESISVFKAPLKPMDNLEAALQLKANRYRFMMYLQINEQKYSVIMARPDGNYSVISPIDQGEKYQETVFKISKNQLTPISEALYPMSKLTIPEARERLDENNLDFLVFVNEEYSQLNLLFHGRHGDLVLKRPAN